MMLLCFRKLILQFLHLFYQTTVLLLETLQLALQVAFVNRNADLILLQLFTLDLYKILNNSYNNKFKKL